VEEVLADTIGQRVPRWALLREYRHTYRDTMASLELLVEGEWFDELGVDSSGIARVSIEDDIAEELNVGIGDRITWDVQGVAIESEIVSVRRIDWTRFEPWFFFVFESGVLEDAPQSIVMMTRIDDPTSRAEMQRDMVVAFPNILALDLTIIIDAIDTLLSKVALAIRFMALFSIGAGIVILIGAIAASRYQRARESVLLKTLGARSRIIFRMLATEYFALGSFAGLAGVALAAIGGWAAVVFVFELDFRLPALPLLAIWLATAALTTVIGMANSREVLRRTPLAGMRDFAE
jgi:putative ABC transport system permease protein